MSKTSTFERKTKKARDQANYQQICDDQQVVWERVTYKDLNTYFSSNYVDETFLDYLFTKNIHASIENKKLKTRVPSYFSEFQTIFTPVCTLLQQLSSVLIYVVAFLNVRQHRISILFLSQINLFCIFLIYLLRVWFRENIKIQKTDKEINTVDQQNHQLNIKNQKFPKTTIFPQRRRIISMTFVLACYLYLMAPLLNSLTNSYSNDTIYCLSFFAMGIHLIFHDYFFIGNIATTKVEKDKEKDKYLNDEKETIVVFPNNISISSFSGLISSNAAVFAVTLLISRLNIDCNDIMILMLFVFAYLLLSCLPIIRAYLYQRSIVLHHYLTIIMTTSACMVVFWFYPQYLLVSISFMLAIAFIGPFLYAYKSKEKITIKGPWDLPQFED